MRPEPVEAPVWPFEMRESALRQTAAPAEQAPLETSMSLAALICGILAVCLFWAVIPGIGLGLASLVFGVRSTVKYPEVLKGQAIAGFILGMTAIALSAFMVFQFLGGANLFSGAMRLDTL